MEGGGVEAASDGGGAVDSEAFVSAGAVSAVEGPWLPAVVVILTVVPSVTVAPGVSAVPGAVLSDS